MKGTKSYQFFDFLLIIFRTFPTGAQAQSPPPAIKRRCFCLHFVEFVHPFILNLATLRALEYNSKNEKNDTENI